MKTNKTEEFTIKNDAGVLQTLTADSVCATLAISSTIDGTKMVCHANLSLHPYTKQGDNYIDAGLPERTFLVANLFDSKDMDVLRCVSKINEALQELILSKNL